MTQQFQISDATKAELASSVTAKDDNEKPRYDLLPPEALEELARLYALGARKYADRNWEKGTRWGRFFAALMRHAWAFWRGQKLDPETGVHHMIAVAWNAIAIFTYDARGVGEDDRHIQEGHK